MESAVETVVTKIGLLVGEEFQKLRGVGGDVALLRDELATMNALLRMQSEAEPGAVDHFLREWLKQLREVAYDSEDCVDLYRFRIKSRRRPGDGFLTWFMGLVTTLWPRRCLADDIRALRARAAAINEQHARYGVSLEPLRRPSPMALVPAAVAPWPAYDPTQLVGTEGQASDLVKMVETRKDDNRLKVISVVGFGGLGKTTLAMEVCRRLQPEFQRQAQVSVSQAFVGTNDDVQGLLKRLLRQIIVNQTDERINPDALVDKLKEAVNDERYLIMIDDVWTVAAWNAILSSLPTDNNCGSRIIVTTRIDSVATACSASDRIYRMKPLSLEDSKKLFITRVFGPKEISCPEVLKDVMDRLLKKCGGLPLAIISIGSVLASYQSPESQHMWERVVNSIGSQMEIQPTLEGMRQIVLLSFEHLPHHLMACVMYLSIFPEDYVIVKKRLLRRWIAEGLIAEKRGLTLMEVAEAYFDELVSRNMIDRTADIVNYYDGREQTCRVHDMMLEVMVSKSLEANFVSVIGGQYEGMSYDRARRLSIHGEEELSQKMSEGSGRRNGINGMNVQQVRSLSMFEVKGHMLLNRLGEFTLLRVLDLENCSGFENKHMCHICRMYLLKFLNLRSTDVCVLPPEVGELEHLQTLDVRQTKLQGLPETVTKLENLESLQFSNKPDYWTYRWEPPKGLRKMKALSKVTMHIGSNNIEVASELGELGQLQELTLFVANNIPPDVLEEISMSLSRLYSLHFLSIEITFRSQIENDLMDHLKSPPPSLRYVRLCGKLGVGTFTWIGKLTNLVEFVIAWAYLRGDTLFNVLCKLPKLKMLTLETYCYADNEVVVKRSQSFPALTELRISRADMNPTSIYKFEEGSMPKLETLVLDFWVGQQNTIGIEHLTNLKEVQFTGPKGSRETVDELRKLEEENGRRKRVGSNQFTVKVSYARRRSRNG